MPEPNKRFFPTINIAPAKGWPRRSKPTPAPGLAVDAYATGLDHPRWLYVLPNGDVLVAETNGPPRPEEERGIQGWVSKFVQQWAGAGVTSANRITLLRDADGDGVAETKTLFLRGLKSPFGMALVGGQRSRRVGYASPVLPAKLVWGWLLATWYNLLIILL